MKTNYLALVAIVVVVLVVVGGGYYLMTHSNTASVSTTMPATSTSTNPQTTSTGSTQKSGSTTSAPSNTYTNSQYSFSFEHPAGVNVMTSGYGSVHPFTSAPVAYLHFGNDQQQTEGNLTINVSSSPTDLNTCNTGQPVVVNGVTFYKTDGGSADASGYKRDYKAQHNGVCYDVEVTSFPSACVSGAGGCTWSAQTLGTMLITLDTFARTFVFTK